MSRTDIPSIEEQYFLWLYSKVGAVSDKNPNHSIFILAEVLHKTNFVVVVANDENRVLEAMQLRDDFVDEVGSWNGSKQSFANCSMLELLISLARNINIQCGGTGNDVGVGVWFWALLKNAGLTRYTDAVILEIGSAEEPMAILEDIITRNYSENGEGGLFPIKKPREDQRHVELWYQMSAYLIENSGILDS